MQKKCISQPQFEWQMQGFEWHKNCLIGHAQTQFTIQRIENHSQRVLKKRLKTHALVLLMSRTCKNRIKIQDENTN